MPEMEIGTREYREWWWRERGGRRDHTFVISDVRVSAEKCAKTLGKRRKDWTYVSSPQLLDGANCSDIVFVSGWRAGREKNNDPGYWVSWVKECLLSGCQAFVFERNSVSELTVEQLEAVR